MKVILHHNTGFQWASHGGLSVKGYAYHSEGRFLRTEGILDYLLPATGDEEMLASALKQLNGIFSFIFTSEDEVYLYCDKSRFFPVFYRIMPETGISDEPEKLRQDKDIANDAAFEEFRCTGFTTGSDTLVQDIRQVPPGELVRISKDQPLTRRKIFSYKVKRAELRYDRDPVGAMAAAIEKAATRFIDSIGDATPVLPLSGGYDSRLIACILKARGFSGTLCFTYGRKTAEVEISGKVAELLGFKWYFVNYEALPENWLSRHEDVFNAYYRYAARLTSMFYLQEFPAVIYLREHGLIPENSIFLPGHSGDLLGGSQFTKVFPVHLAPKKIIPLLIRKKYSNFPINRRTLKFFRRRLKAELDLQQGFLAYSIVEDWDIREKIAKFIFNSSQVFTFFGYQVRFFFWDNELVEFFRCLPPEYKNYKKLYDHCLQEQFFARYGLNFSRELLPGRGDLLWQKLKELVKPFLPRILKMKYMRKNDWACYEKLTNKMIAEMNPSLRKKIPYNGFNSVLINWYLNEVEKNLT